MADIFDDLGAFGAIVNAFGRNPGGDKNSIFPASDAEDLCKGAAYIPGEVTDLRRAGNKVFFFQPDKDKPDTWYWRRPDGSQIRYS